MGKITFSRHFLRQLTIIIENITRVKKMQIVNTIVTITLDKPLDLLQLHRKIKASEQGKSHRLKYRLQPGNQYVALY